jgi:hypothetical protein
VRLEARRPAFERFTGNYLEDDPSGYVALGLYRAFRRLRSRRA